MKFYRLTNKEMPWGDYGDILLTGMTAHLDRQDGLLQLERTAPFLPPMTISGIDDLLVDDTTKNKIEQSGLKGFEFLPVIKRHISFVDWTTWDLNADDPNFYPDNGEPENYILELPHSQTLADEMENIWEVVCKVNGRFTDSSTFIRGDLDLDIMRTENSGWFIISETAKNWIEENISNYIVCADFSLQPY